MKKALKIILFSFLSVVGAFGLVIGGMYLFGGFEEKPVFATNLSFSKSEIITSTAFELDITTTTPDVTRRQVVLEVSGGGDDIIYYTTTANIGERISIAPKRDANNKNIGGYVKLTARYADKDSTSTASATCNILIDVPVEDATIQQLSSPKFESEILLVESGTRLSDFITTYPANSLKPYASMTVINNAGFTTLKNKSIFLEATYRDEANIDVAKLKINGAESTLLELPYQYDSTINDFVISSDVYVMPSQSFLRLGINCYVVPTVEMMNNSSISATTALSMGLINDTQEMIVKNYSVDSMTFDGDDKTIYFNETKRFYINNEEATDGYNLGLTLNNNKGIRVSDDLLKAYFHIADFEGNDVTISNLNNEENSDKTSWYFEFKYSDFETYYNYLLDPSDSNKLPIYLYYTEPESSQLEYSFYLVPDIHNVERITAKGSNNITLNNGDVLNMADKAEVVGQGSSPFSDIGYFIPMNTANNVSTTPSEIGAEYKVEFDFIFPIEDKIDTISLYPNSSWTELKNTHITVKTQDDVEVFKATYGATGSVDVDTQNIIQAGTLLKVVIDSVTIKSATNGYIPLLTVSAQSGRGITINNRQTKFYQIISSEPSDVPYLSVNGVVYGCKFDYFENNGNYYVLIDTLDSANADYRKLNGVGNFTINAMLFYQEAGKIYLLDRSTVFSVQVKEVINDGDVVASGYDASSGAVEFTSATIDTDENLADDFYIYITSSKMLALKSAIENNKVHISASYVLPSDSVLRVSELQSYLQGDTDDSKLNTIKSVMQNINRNAITFASAWEEVRDSKNVVVGYRIKYNINQVYTISLDGEDLDCKFAVDISIETEDGDKSAEFNVTGGSKPSSIVFNVKDKVYNSVYISKEEMNLSASVATDGGLTWKIDNASTGTDFDIQYGLKYKDSTTMGPDLSSEAYCSLTIVSNDNSESTLPSAYYYFDNDGKLHFNNFPYKEDGYKVKMTVKQNVLSDDKCHYIFNSQTNSFDKKIYDEISGGKSIIFTIIGMQISITQTDFVVAGSKGNEVTLFGPTDTNTIFKVDIKNGDGTSATGIIKYDSFFLADLIGVGSSSAVTLTSIDNNKLVINKDFIKDESLGFRFSYYGDNTYPFLVNGSSNVFAKEIKSAFEIQLKEDFYMAPSSDSYATFTYNSVSAYEKTGVNFKMTALTDDYNSLYAIDNVEHTFIFKTCTEGYTFGVRVTISVTDEDEMVRTATFDYVNAIQVAPKYKDDMIEMGRLVPVDPLDPEGENEMLVGEMIAGTNHALSVASGEIVLSGALSSDQSNVNRVEVSFEDISHDVSPLASLHMRQNGSDVASFGLFSYDLSESKQVKVIITFYFEDGGTFVAIKTMNIQPNLNVVLAGSSLGTLTLNSGSTINLSSGNNFLIYKDDVMFGTIDNRYFEPDGEDYRYSRDSFDFGTNESYFLDVNASNPSDPYILYVNYGPAESKDINVAFTYVVDTEPLADSYEVLINLAIKLNILAQG